MEELAEKIHLHAYILRASAGVYAYLCINIMQESLHKYLCHINKNPSYKQQPLSTYIGRHFIDLPVIPPKPLNII